MTFRVYFVFLMLFVTYFGVQVYATADYYFSSFCKAGRSEEKTIQTTSGGYGSTGYIKTNDSYNPEYPNGLDCTLVLSPRSGYGITLSVERINLRQSGIFCSDTITIERSSYSYGGPWYNELSSTCYLYFSREFSNSGAMRIIFKTDRYSSLSTYGNNFRIYYSTYSKQNVGAIAGGVVGAFVFLLIVVGVLFIRRRRQLVVRSTTTTVCAPPTTMGYPGQSYENPQAQPYGYNQQQVPQQCYANPQPPPYSYNQQQVPQ